MVFWLKELLIWGTLEPVASYLLARGGTITRREAESASQLYCQHLSPDLGTNEKLDARMVRDWADAYVGAGRTVNRSSPPSEIPVTYLRDDLRGSPQQLFRVVPLLNTDEVQWSDPGGFHLASSNISVSWSQEFFREFDFVLDAQKEVVTSRPYF